MSLNNDDAIFWLAKCGVFVVSCVRAWLAGLTEYCAWSGLVVLLLLLLVLALWGAVFRPTVVMVSNLFEQVSQSTFLQCHNASEIRVDKHSTRTE